MFIVQDENYRGMWRILSLDGAISDMVNKARAKDAAKTIAARKLSTATAIVSPSRLHWIKTDDPRQNVKEQGFLNGDGIYPIGSTKP